MNIGTRIKQLRTERGISQEALADVLDVSRQAVAKWESGTSKPSTANLLALCRVFEIPLNGLLAESSNQDGRAVKNRKNRKPLLIAALAAGAVLFVLSIIKIILEKREIAGYIGYADAQTSITVIGASPVWYFLGSAAIVLILLSLYLLCKKGGTKT